MKKHNNSIMQSIACKRFVSSFQSVKGMKDIIGKDAWLFSRVCWNFFNITNRLLI